MINKINAQACGFVLEIRPPADLRDHFSSTGRKAKHLTITLGEKERNESDNRISEAIHRMSFIMKEKRLNICIKYKN